MWVCPNCQHRFLHTNQGHSCNDKSVADFTKGKTTHTLELFHHFLEEYQKIGDFILHPAKSRIALAKNTRFCSINQLGKDFIHFVFQFSQPYHENFCFIKVSQLPGTNTWNHHCRIYSKDDLNEEVRKFMQLAYEQDAKKTGIPKNTQ
ncbi:DUF5655 domain-containing protein [Adhaeribacter aquaticus]|uniref:DUF5655 domain-containing protein n=1 Tax=Adhaeribacter aquaticus TaxID=299567 RepID=UPI0003F9BF61|nr:DUF5655 domain-containing protein [Adhaeribacter aquaticus]